MVSGRPALVPTSAAARLGGRKADRPPDGERRDAFNAPQAARISRRSPGVPENAARAFDERPKVLSSRSR